MLQSSDIRAGRYRFPCSSVTAASAPILADSRVVIREIPPSLTVATATGRWPFGYNEHLQQLSALKRDGRAVGELRRAFRFAHEAAVSAERGSHRRRDTVDVMDKRP